MVTILIAYLLTGLIFIGLAIPLIRRRIRPNPWYGFRIRQTLENPEIWYEANWYMGRYLLVIGILLIGVALGLYLVPQMDIGTYVVVCTVVLLAALGLSLIRGLGFVQKLVRENVSNGSRH